MEDERSYYSDSFKKIANSQKIMLNNRMAEHEITYVQSLVILYLLRMRKLLGTEYEVSQKDVEKYLSLKASTVTHILNRMEESGYLRREKSKKDSRTNLLYPTDLGITSISLFFEVLDELEMLMTDGMSPAEKQQLEALLQKILANFEKQRK